VLRADVVVIGGGHAGIEAAHAAAKLGAKVLLALPNPEKIGLMPCNPAIGGPGKSQLVFELQALGGVMGRLADQTAIHTRTLNESKGPAVRSLRVQNGRDNYANAARHLIEGTPGIEIVRGEVATLETDRVNGCKLKGITLTDGRIIETTAAVLCTGTFLAGVVWYGTNKREAGRQGEPPARYLSKSLRDTGHRLARFKTGTPPRIRAQSVDFSVLSVVNAESPPKSFAGIPGEMACSSATWITHTTPETHALIEENLHRSAMYGGMIDGKGPRYCPSIEDKVVRFADKDRHLLFVEPEGTQTSEVYLQGFSSSMPPILQDNMVRTLPGFESAEIHRYAYAVEYDALDPTGLDITLMSKAVKGLFSAGQINGTSGYEEAAVQGLIAGVNAARFTQNEEPVWVPRTEGYIGVLLDDLVRWGIDEPYRMLTSRNEHRLHHRQDNAAERLTGTGYSWGLVEKGTLETETKRTTRIQKELERLKTVRYKGKTGLSILCRPNHTYKMITDLIGPPEDPLSEYDVGRLEILARYNPYISRAMNHLKERSRFEALRLEELDYWHIPSMSSEGSEVLHKHKPRTLGAAQRLRGVRDSDITALLVHLRAR
jgi:tRNA uridine 5-carboxymethylaminomethyl modification enzyme